MQPRVRHAHRPRFAAASRASVFLCLILTGGIWPRAYAAAPTFNWVTSQTSGTTNDEGFAITTDSSSNTLLAGYFMSPVMKLGSFAVTNNSVRNNANIFVAKLDPNGNVVWLTSAGGSINDRPADMVLDASSNLYVCGAFQSPTARFGSITITNDNTNGLPNIFLAKYNPSGVPLWVSQAGCTNGATGGGVAVDSLGDGCLLGFYSNILSVAGTNFNSANGNFFLSRFNSSGVLSNPIQFGGTNVNSLNRGGVGFDKNGNIYVAASFSGLLAFFGSVTLTNYDMIGSGSGNAFLAKYDTNENLIWVRQFGGNGQADVGAAAFDGAGNSFVAGDMQSPTNFFGSITLTTNTGFKYLVKYDSSGNALWVDQSTLSGVFNSGTMTTVGLTLGSGGFIYLSGHFAATNVGFGGLTLTNANIGAASEGYIYGFDPFGKVLWGREIAGTNRITAMAIDAADRNRLTGWYQGPANFDSRILPGTNFEQIFVAELNPGDQPTLNISPAGGGNVALSWLTSYTNFSLYTETNVVTPTWARATGSVATVGSNFVVTNTASGTMRFYRLQSP